MPGLVDTHIHAPQYPNAGLGLDLPLLDWLQQYTFPMEARFGDLDFARSCYKKVVVRGRVSCCMAKGQTSFLASHSAVPLHFTRFPCIYYLTLATDAEQWDNDSLLLRDHSSSDGRAPG